jgi:hypothetical protein
MCWLHHSDGTRTGLPSATQSLRASARVDPREMPAASVGGRRSMSMLEYIIRRTTHRL